MNLSFFVNKTIEEIKNEVNKDENMDIIKNDILNPCIEHVINKLYPYMIKCFIGIIIFFIIIIIILFLNIKIIYKN